MNRPFTALLLALLLAAPALGADYKVGDRLPESAAGKSAYKTISWDDLLPKDWDPMAAFKGIDLAKLDDADPRAGDALEKMRKAWDAAPVNRAMDGQNIRLPGFVVSLDGGPGELREFLLVPYFGACIHVPPPGTPAAAPATAPTATKPAVRKPVLVKPVSKPAAQHEPEHAEPPPAPPPPQMDKPDPPPPPRAPPPAAPKPKRSGWTWQEGDNPLF